MEEKISDDTSPRNSAVVRLSSLGGKCSIGVNWSCFFNVYIVQQATSRNTFSGVCSFIEKIITESVAKLRQCGIELIFVFDGLVSDFLSFSFSEILSQVKKLLNSLNVEAVYSPSGANAQLSYMLRAGKIKKVFSEQTIAFHGVSEWISFINFDSMEATEVKATSELVAALSKNAAVAMEKHQPVFDGEKIIIPETEKNPFSKMNIDALNCISAGIITQPRIPRPPTGPAQKNPLITLPRNCVAYLNDISELYFSVFRGFSKMEVGDIVSSSGILHVNEFLPLMLQQNPLTAPIEINATIFSNVLAAQNIVSRSFTTLFETMKSISTNEVAKTTVTKEDLPKKVAAEAVRRYLTAHEYIAPGGGLSPWGRAVLNTNAGNDIPTLYFIEMVRADAMDVEIDSIPVGGVGVTDIIERTFMFFPTKTQPPEKAKPKIGTFDAITRIISHSLANLFGVIIADTYYNIASSPTTSELKEIIGRLGFLSFKSYSTGTLMRFLIEASEDLINDFVDNVEDYDQLKADVKAAFKWWNDLQRGTKELKQRSLKPNSRVSNLKNFLILFECADQFVQKRMTSVCEILDI